MKQLLSFLTLILMLAGNTIQAQCTPDTTLSGSNIYYAPSGSKSYNVNGENIIVLPYAQASQSYDEAIQFKVPTDTSISGLMASIDYIKLVSIQNLPGTISVSCNPSNCTFPGGSFGCAQLAGIAGGPDSVQLEVSVEYKFSSNGTVVTAQDTIRNIYLVTKGSTVGLSALVNKGLSVKFLPNPAKNIGNLTFHSNSPSATEVKITNVIGNVVFVKRFEAVSGENKLTLNLSELPQGIYLYSVRSGGNSHSGRFVISR